MQHLSSIARNLRRFRNTSCSNPEHKPSTNLLKRNFRAIAPNKVWVGDVTYFSTWSGWGYLALLMNMYRRTIVGAGGLAEMRQKPQPSRAGHGSTSAPATTGLIYHRLQLPARNVLVTAARIMPRTARAMATLHSRSDERAAETWFKRAL
jgi:hypothetical protein